jgi:hypothetical protein
MGRGNLTVPLWSTMPFCLNGEQMIHFGWDHGYGALWTIQEKGEHAEELTYQPDLPLPQKLANTPPEILAQMARLSRKIEAVLDAYEATMLPQRRLRRR